MNKIYIFDVDGTLTPSRRKMTHNFEMFFYRWADENAFYLVSGSDLEKIKEQVPKYILDLAEGVFTCGGNKFYIKDNLIYENNFEPPETLINYLEEMVKISSYPVKAGTHIENRGAMLNFSMIGRDCSLQQLSLIHI